MTARRRRLTVMVGVASCLGAALLAGVAMPVEAVAATSNQNLENYQLMAPVDVITAPAADQGESDNLVSFQRNYGYQENGEQKTTPAPLKVTTDWENKNNEPVSMFGIRQSMYDSANGDLVTGKDQREDMTDDETRAKCAQFDNNDGLLGFMNPIYDFMAESLVDFNGPPCAAYEMEPVEDYEPELPREPVAPAGCATTGCGFPYTSTAASSATLEFLPPEFSNKIIRVGDPVTGAQRKLGWLIPVAVKNMGDATNIRIQAQLGHNNSTGGNSPFGAPTALEVANLNAGFLGRNPNCVTKVTFCISLQEVLLSAGSNQVELPETVYRLQTIVNEPAAPAQGFIGNWVNVNGTPYIDIRYTAPNTVPEPQSPVVNNITNNYYSNGEVASCTTRSYRETDPMVPRPCAPQAPDDWVLESTENYQQRPDGSWTGEKQITPTTPEYQEWKSENPECGVKVCILDLVLVGVGSCFNLGDRCDGWASDPDKGTKYQCMYGAASVSLLECEIYSRTFNQANRDGGFAYGTDIIPVASISTPPASQPQEPPPGADDDTPVSTPTPTPTPGGGYTPPPGTGGDDSDAAQGGHADPNGDGEEGCWPTGWAMFNPVQWVLQPVKCAMDWAFVPDEEKMNEVNAGITLALDASAFGQSAAIVEGINIGILEGCGGIPLNLAWSGIDLKMSILDACSPELRGAALIVKPILNGVLWTATALAVLRYIGGVFGFVQFGREAQAAQDLADKKRAMKS